MKHIDSWKNKKVFEKQLATNRLELDGNPPPHWKELNLALEFLLTKHDHLSLLDVGCGVGVYKELCNRISPNIKYVGMDYSEDAVTIAKEEFGDHFYCGNYKDLTKEDAQKFDILHAGALLDMLPDGDDALDFLLGLGFKYVLIGRVAAHQGEPSKVVEYGVYNEITTYKFTHNFENLSLIGAKHSYNLTLGGGSTSLFLMYTKYEAPKLI
jgi:trans-aconitate methyltransferase